MFSFSGYCAFTHKAGIHAKAILNNPSTYEILKPEDFGLTRYVSIGFVFLLPWFYMQLLIPISSHFSHRLTGWNAVKSRVEQLGLELNDAEVRTPFLPLSPNLLLIAFLHQDQGCHLQDQGTR